ncbi:Nucleotide-binding universal stress protein, UspA family [Halogranum rubrum]|uniref:Nucleotide-binding universal stress protein, UspA family n=2 Tax=Halogranum rubrum TaxID=553466 RepID=A0A1I4CEU0_9EURY|nr:MULTISPECIES: universal stress protein [Halogranum]EJN59383.1 universal stress protein uspa-like protein [Halogranum salarium B-1]SFK79465.1 Nucleotide-binding universal stress protein, UspA family [Halogranum rubrum]
MNRALVVVTDSTRSKQILREAGELAASNDAELVLLSVAPTESYEDTHDAVASIGSSDLVYTIEQAEESAVRNIERTASEAFDGLDVDYHTKAVFGREVDSILDVAEAYDCDHLFIAGRRRSPTGKALFGDLTQQVLLTFDGPVTVLLGDEE